MPAPKMSNETWSGLKAVTAFMDSSAVRTSAGRIRGYFSSWNNRVYTAVDERKRLVQNLFVMILSFIGKVCEFRLCLVMLPAEHGSQEVPAVHL
ncbi:unnamed protein product [Strongylus vulgaris]|uniref:Uncharacterized protein n=1 Tax=Strongylus vulgaris TaxID=40348 RepID=A0A3P7JT80_STRVU|nr:unnamed protein product [Strongylus vulgaris]